MPVGEVTVTLEDVLYIFSVPIDGEVVTSWTDSSHDFLVTHSLAIFGNESQLSSSSNSYINLSWVCHIRDTQPLDTRESVMRYVRCHIFCLLGTTLFADKSTAYASAKYLPLLQNFDQISSYSWGSACLAHLYRSLCRVSRWSHHLRTRKWMAMTQESIRYAINFIEERSYVGIIILAELHTHLDVYDTVRPLVSFKCIEWIPVD
ncbi:hypothetical protein AHAS_Ahas15G0201200 [Arachis hypogaea]